jgi:bacteriocin biosynthesis cyclodehydratase domain-containing protein
LAHNLRLKRHYSLIAHSADVVELRYGVWNPTSFTLTDQTKSGKLFTILSRLDGSLSPSELAAREHVPRTEVEGLLDHLLELGVLESTASNALDHYLEDSVPNFRRKSNGDPATPPVVLIGDSDLVAEIHRHLIQALPDARAEIIDRNDPAGLQLAEPDAAWLLDGLEFQKRVAVFEKWRNAFIVAAMKVIDPVQLRVLNRVSLEYRIPWIHAALDGPFLFVGPIFVPHRSACYECLETRVMMNLRGAASYQSYKAALVDQKVITGKLPMEPILGALLASHTALETLNYLLTQASFTVGKVLAIYLPTMEFTFNEVLRVPGCPACSPLAERDEKELYFDMRSLIRPRDDRPSLARP